MRIRSRAASSAFGYGLVAALVARCSAAVPPADSPVPEGTSDAAVTRGGASDQVFSRIEELLEGRVPGVQVIRRSDGNFSIRIRGTSSPSGANEPLVVIDETPVLEQRVGQALALVNPQDVVRIDVLKDAASTALYGMRGANGVIVITTRRQ
jgi:TonB-dependent SusC/RagA subfamily outer membrane receptor